MENQPRYSICKIYAQQYDRYIDLVKQADLDLRKYEN